MMYHMTSGICQCAQRTCSLRMYNMLHEHDACIIHTYTRPHFFEICFKMPEQNCTRPNLPSLSCMDTYGQPDSLDFVIGILCPPGLNYNRNCPIGWFCAEVGMYLKATSREYFSYVLTFGRSHIWNGLQCYLFWSGGSNLTKWCALGVFPHFSTHSMNATMKVNGKFWTLALGFKEGLSLGDGTSSQSTWGVNSVLSNLNNWREDAGRMKATILWYFLCENSGIWQMRCFASKSFKVALEMTLRPMKVLQSVSIAALRPDSIGLGKKQGPPRSCDDSGECRTLAAQMCEWEQVA